jgi:hypothetical protein
MKRKLFGLSTTLLIIVALVVPIIPIGIVSAAPIIIAANDSDAGWKVAATAVCDAVDDQITINTYLTGGATVELAPGTYEIEDFILPATGDHLYGQGNTTILHLNGGNSGILVNNVNNVEVDNLKITGDSYFAGSLLIQCNATDVSNFYIHDITNEALIGTDFLIYANEGEISNVRFVRCVATAPDNMGFMINGEGVTSVVSNVVYYECDVTNAGIAITRFNDWVTGFDYCEYPNIVIDRIYTISCTVDGSWESAFHYEIAPVTSNTVIINSDSTDSGLKAGGAVFGAGFLFDATEDIILYNNTALNSDIADMRAWSGGVYDDITPPENKIYPVGSIKTTSGVAQGNVAGIIITNGTFRDLVIYSTDANPVNQQIELG